MYQFIALTANFDSLSHIIQEEFHTIDLLSIEIDKYKNNIFKIFFSFVQFYQIHSTI